MLVHENWRPHQAAIAGGDLKTLQSLSKEIIILHPGPINRGVEITSEVADSSQSIILQQVENGV